jgi:hypothetical protein
MLLSILMSLASLHVMAQDDGDDDEDMVEYDPEACFVAAESNDTMVQYEAKEGPYVIGISNSYIGNAWRTQMIQMAQAFSETEDVAPLIDELVIVSTGEDIEGQIAAMDNMIALGVDAIVINAINPTSFDAVVERAADAGIPVISFDGIVEAPQALIVNEDQVEFGAVMAQDLVDRISDGVSDDVNRFQQLLTGYQGSSHEPYHLKLVWGNLLFKGRAVELGITYKLFNPDGQPIRAVAKVKFKKSIEEKKRAAREDKKSADLTHQRQVKAGDTLPLMCQRIYGDPKYYLNVAQVNGLGNFRQLQPGMQLVFPPVEKTGKADNQ